MKGHLVELIEKIKPREYGIYIKPQVDDILDTILMNVEEAKSDYTAMLEQLEDNLDEDNFREGIVLGLVRAFGKVYFGVEGKNEK